MDMTLNDVEKYIAQSNDAEIRAIMDAVRSRFLTAFPDWEVIYLACPKHDPLLRAQTLDWLTKYFSA